MDKNDAVTLALLGIGGGHGKAYPKPRHSQEGCQSRKPGPQTARQTIEGLGCSIVKPTYRHVICSI